MPEWLSVVLGGAAFLFLCWQLLAAFARGWRPLGVPWPWAAFCFRPSSRGADRVLSRSLVRRRNKAPRPPGAVGLDSVHRKPAVAERSEEAGLPYAAAPQEGLTGARGDPGGLEPPEWPCLVCGHPRAYGDVCRWCVREELGQLEVRP